MTQEIMEEIQNPMYASTYAQLYGGMQQQQSGEEEQQNNGPPGGGTGGSLQQQDAGTGEHMEKNEKIDRAKHVVSALHSLKKKSPEDVKKLRSAAQTLARNK
jgi:hypothetical protein